MKTRFSAHMVAEGEWNIADAASTHVDSDTLQPWALLPFNLSQHTAEAIAWQLNLERHKQTVEPF